MYDPSIGRWLSVDPLGFDAKDVNLYRYVGNQPVCMIDPTGLEEGAIIWDDFVGDPPVPPTFYHLQQEKARVYWRFKFGWGCNTIHTWWPPGSDCFNIEVTGDRDIAAEINKDLSWVIPGYETPELLNHERLHMAITQKVVAIAEQKIRAIRAPSGPWCKSENVEIRKQEAKNEWMRQYNAIIRQMSSLAQSINDQYDIESEHGSNPQGQLLWESNYGERVEGAWGDN